MGRICWRSRPMPGRASYSARMAMTGMGSDEGAAGAESAGTATRAAVSQTGAETTGPGSARVVGPTTARRAVSMP